MNRIEIRKHIIPSGYKTRVFFIDDKPLYEYFNVWVSKGDELWERLRKPDMLEITWGDVMDFEGDNRFMRFLLQQDKACLPILSCPDDMDFSCIIIVAEIEKTNEFVYWKRIGTVNHSIERLEERKEHGIVFVDSYSDDDWIKYRDAAFMRVDSYEWKEWTSTHWSEELFRRHINYTYKCYQDDRNIDWIYTCNWCFDRKQYDSLVSECVPKWCMGNDE